MGWHARRFGLIDAVGLTALLTYVLAALNILPVMVSERVTLALVFAIGPVAMMAVIGIHLLLRSSPAVFWLRVGTTFLIVAFALLNLMLVVQQMVRLQFRAFRASVHDAAQAAQLDAIFKGTNAVQLGIDVSFDIFYCLGMVALSCVMYGDRRFGRALGTFGVVSAAALLLLNLATFPYGPADAGLVDLGPLTAVWWLLVIIQIKRAASGAEGPPSAQPDAPGVSSGVR
jgi:energy-coupling factor transporter transmembrane protein EcfT